MNDSKAELRRKLNEAEEKISATIPERQEKKKSSRPVVVGDTVEINSIGAKAQVVSISPDRTLVLQAGIMKVTAREDEVTLIDTPKTTVKKPKVSTGVTGGLRPEPVKPELDIRGLMVDEAIPVVERFIDSAVMAKLNTVTVIHGKGTGALRAAVHQCLKGDRHVKSFRLGRFGEGENGVTVIELK